MQRLLDGMHPLGVLEQAALGFALVGPGGGSGENASKVVQIEQILRDEEGEAPLIQGPAADLPDEGESKDCRPKVRRLPVKRLV